jgi:mono/diheme cytochrome c family protein
LVPLVGAALCFLATGRLKAQDHAGQYEQTDIAYGSSLYAAHCIACHGGGGDALPGVNLRSGRFRNASSDRELTNILRVGIPGTAMTAGEYTVLTTSQMPSYAEAFTDDEIADMLAYLRSLKGMN